MLAGARYDTIKADEDRLYELKDNLEMQIQSDQDKLNTLPDPEVVKQQAGELGWEIFQQYDNRRFRDLSYEEKRNILSWLFEGRDEHVRTGSILTRMGGLLIKPWKLTYMVESIHSRLLLITSWWREIMIV